MVTETDANEVVKLWRNHNEGRLEIASILQEIEELNSNMEVFRLTFVGHEANEGAHLCAKQDSASRRRCLWIRLLHLHCPYSSRTVVTQESIATN